MRDRLYRISAVTSVEAEEAVAEALGSITERPVTTYHELESGTVRVSVFLDSRRQWTCGCSRNLRKALRRIEECGLSVGPASISLKPVPRTWAESWKRHFKPLEIGGRLLIKPGWSKKKPKPNEATITLDPGLSFGTGQHPTTAFCLGELVRHAKHSKTEELSLLDLGTGSGILAIAAAKLGYRRIHALDFDPDCIRIAKENAERNQVSGLIRFQRQDVTRLPRVGRKFSVVCANVTADLLIQTADRIVNRMAPGGSLALAGVLEREFARVRDCYKDLGLMFARGKTEKEWRSGVFVTICPAKRLRTGGGILAPLRNRKSGRSRLTSPTG